MTDTADARWQLRPVAQAALARLDALEFAPTVSPHGDHRQLHRIGAAVRTLEIVEAELTDAVLDARAHGHSWTAIATQLGTTHQAVRERFGSAQQPRLDRRDDRVHRQLDCQ